MPTGANLFSILETTQADVVADRFSSGGLNVGGLARVGGFLGSWSQTQYRIGDVSISSPTDGAPLLFPELAFWDRVRITTGLMPADINAPGLAVTLEPARPSTEWTRTIEGSAAGGSLVARASSSPPPIIRLRDWSHGSVRVGGPLARRRVGLVMGGAWTRNSTFERADPATLRGNVLSAFTHVTFAPRADREVRALGWIQRAQTRTNDVSAHVQSTLERSARGATSWRLFGGYTQRHRTRDTAVMNDFVVDRLIDGPIHTRLPDGDITERRWSFGGTLTPVLHSRHTLQLGSEIEATSARTSPSFVGLIGELVDGVPARIWSYTNSGLVSHRHATTVAAFASDRITMSPRLFVDLALRFEAITGRADGAGSGISWRTLLPSAMLRWRLGTPGNLLFLTGYRRSSNQLLFGLLAHGDPAAPVATVFRWNGAFATSGPLVARVGPGTDGDETFTRIDPGLDRPVTDEFAIGLESRPRAPLRLSLVGIARRESSLINVVNIGVPLTSYSAFNIEDDNVDLLGTADDHQLTVYNRSPESFGKDRYLLTNPRQDAATLGALVITAEAMTDRLFLLISATAAAALGAGGNRGFRATENDQDLPGELFSNPNASTFARGRVFSDRAYTIKWTTVYRFPKDVRLGAIARYQDGQPFARMVVVPGLNQGPEAIQAFANGASRFAFTGTLDVRLQKGFVMASTRLDAIVDAYNLLNMKKEVEEYVVTGNRFRTTTAVQPPRAIHVGVRMTW